MPDLADGESIEMQGSGSKPYVLRNVGGVYSCSCPAWRNQSIAIEKRTCKHLRKLRGDAEEEERVGTDLPERAKKAKEDVKAPPLLLAEKWDNALDPAGWWLSEKLDGVRAYWDGTTLWSRLGNPFYAPDWFLAGLPNVPLDGELWLGRKKFQRAVSIVKRQDKSDHWKEIRYVVFDAPKLEKGFEDRMKFVAECLHENRPEYVQAHEHQVCQGVDHLKQELARLEALGGEGLMMRRAGSKYEAGRSATLLKVKTFHDTEARVLKHVDGAGRHKGRMGALFVELADGTTFSVGTGFSDAERDNPPAVGSMITFRYQELSDKGVPRFPSYVGPVGDAPKAPLAPELKGKGKGATASPAPLAPVLRGEGMGVRSSITPLAPVLRGEGMVVRGSLDSKESSTRRFEFSDDKSSKFWEITRNGTEVKVRYGRIGSDGQTNVKSFSDEGAATRHAEKLIQEKTDKGYEEVG